MLPPELLDKGVGNATFIGIRQINKGIMCWITQKQYMTISFKWRNNIKKNMTILNIQFISSWKVYSRWKVST